MHSKEEIFTELKNILIELFGINEENITPDASLYDELDLDSIDAIDLVVKLQKMTDNQINPKDFKNARIVNDVIDLIYNLVKT